MNKTIVNTQLGVTAPLGYKASGIHCGIRKNTTKKDLALVISDVECTVSAVYTQNKVFGAPITVTKENIANGKARGIVVNSGNANTCNADGIEKAKKMCQIVAKSTGLDEKDFVVASTGVIGKVFDIRPVENAMDKLVKQLNYQGGLDAAEAIMTTDLVTKQACVKISIDNKEVTIGGMCKGSGMIAPNMATMLGFITTDVAISFDMLAKALKEVVQDTFNMVSVDGDTSTNDTVAVLANGLAGNDLIDEENDKYKAFKDALFLVCQSLSTQMAKDGEGATKLVVVEVKGAKDKNNAKILAKAVIQSSLVKAAMFGADANWGRILCAMGYSGADVDVAKIGVSFESKAGKIEVAKNGAGIEFSEAIAKNVLKENEIYIKIECGDGDANSTAWGCDLSYEYVRINGDYRT